MEESPVAESVVFSDDLETKASGPPDAERRPICLDRLVLLLLCFEALTGIGLMLHYRPTLEHAYADLVDLHEVSSLGFVRELHQWGADAALILVMLHVLRLGFRGSYFASSSRGSWTLAVALLLIVFALSSTGRVLPRDQQAVQLVELADSEPGSDVEGGSLLWVYIAHCIGIPLLAIVLVSYLVKRGHDGTAGPDAATH